MINEQQFPDQITIGGAPDAQAIEDLKARGFRAIVDLRTPNEADTLAEKASVEAVGLDYAAIPVSPALLDDLAVDRFMGAITSSDGPVAVHCKGGGRAGVMSLLHLAVTHGWTIEHALQEGEKLSVKIGPDSPYRPFFEDYLRRHSAGERS